jgi:hypothetical protein
MRTRSLFLLLSVTTGVACAHKAPPAETREERREERHEARREERREHERAMEDRREHAPGDWERLGERTVDGARDRDVITVGAKAGSFRKIMIVVEHSAVELHDVVVNFSDGTHFSPQTRLVLEPASRTGVIDLPGAARVIRTVEFRYGNLPGGGRAEVQLWAR